MFAFPCGPVSLGNLEKPYDLVDGLVTLDALLKDDRIVVCFLVPLFMAEEDLPPFLDEAADCLLTSSC